jgi:hypothetical protein
MRFRGKRHSGRVGMRWSRKFLALLACCVAVSAALVGHASGGQIFQERYHDEGSVQFDNFCGVDGLPVRIDFVIDGKVRAVSHGPDGFAYFLDHHQENVVYTNPANGKSVNYVEAPLTVHDLKVTDNGDGTLTILEKVTGNSVFYGPDGKATARDPGQERFEILVDDSGTPADPFDDEFIAQSSFTKSTGRTDDFCAAIVSALT